MEIITSFIAFFALVAVWFVMPAAPVVSKARTQSVPEALPTAA